ncbi:MAG: hypothetical protein ACRDCH_00640 [Metamycoplasmataceae bacterium]
MKKVEFLTKKNWNFDRNVEIMIEKKLWQKVKNYDRKEEIEKLNQNRQYFEIVTEK